MSFVAQPTNTQFAIGVHMLTLLAAHGSTPTSSEEMAVSGDASPVYVRRVLGRLRDAGLVASRPGVGGGWVLRRPPQQITLADVWRAIQGNDRLLGLHDVNPGCAIGQQIHRNLADVERRAASAIEAELDQLTIIDMHPDLRHVRAIAG